MIWRGAILATALAVAAHGQGDYGDAFDEEGMYGMDPYGGMGGMGDYDDYGGYGGGGPSYETLADKDEVRAFPERDPFKPAVIGFIAEDSNSEDLYEFSAAATLLVTSDVRVAVVTDASLLEELKYAGTRVSAFLPERFAKEKVDRIKHRYPGKHLDSTTLATWVFQVTTPSVGQLTEEGAARYKALHLPEVTLFTKVDLEKNPKGWDYYANRLRKVAENFPKNSVLFNIADRRMMWHRMGLHKITLDEEDTNAVGVGLRHGEAYYRMDEPFSTEAVTEFCKKFFNDQLQLVHVEPEQAPAAARASAGREEPLDDVDETHVVVLDNKNFEKEIGDKSIDSMVEFYAPWCGHCQALKPEYAKLAEKLAGVSGVKIAKFDGDAHPPPASFDVQGFPTLYFVKGGDISKAIAYQGEREADEMLAFIKEHASVAFEA